MRVLLTGDVAHTGFGRVTRELAAGLMAIGHEVRVIGINHRGYAGEFAGIVRSQKASLADRFRAAGEELASDPLLNVMIPAAELGDAMGHNLTGPALRGELEQWPGWIPEAQIVVADPKAMFERLSRDGGAIGHAHNHGVRTLNYVPIEGRGLPPSSRVIWGLVEPVAMSEFGAEQLGTLLGREVPVAYHGVSDAFRPISATDPGSWKGRAIGSKDAAKEAIGLPGRTIILRTDRYIFRKNYPAFFRVIRPVLADHPDVTAVIHTVLSDDEGRGDIRESLSREPGAVPVGPVDWAHPQITLTRMHDSFRGLTDAELRVLYNAADVYVSPTMAEGFGLCQAESLACGVPVVTTDYSAVPEVVGPGGVLVPPAYYLTNAYAHEWALVDEPAMTAGIERLIAKPALRRELGNLGRRHVARFTWSRTVEVFDRLLTEPAAVAA